MVGGWVLLLELVDYGGIWRGLGWERFVWVLNGNLLVLNRLSCMMCLTRAEIPYLFRMIFPQNLKAR